MRQNDGTINRPSRGPSQYTNQSPISKGHKEEQKIETTGQGRGVVPACRGKEANGKLEKPSTLIFPKK